MKAYTYSKYGSVNNLKLSDVAKPTPKNDEILVKIIASSINDWDWGLINGKPLVNRFLNGFFKPKNKILGCDIAGIVEAVRKDISLFKPGDEVYGDASECQWGAFAQFICIKENYLGLKPLNLSFEEAAAIPQAGILAYLGIGMLPNLNSNSKILINGAGGGVGTFGLQLAGQAKVTCVDESFKLPHLKELGAHKVIDYKTTDYTQLDEPYDLIIDNVAQKSIFAYKKVLTTNGIYAIVGGKMRIILAIALFGSWLFKKQKKTLKIVIHTPITQNLNELAKIFESNKIKPIIDSVYTFEDLPQALEKYGKKDFFGKIVIKINH